MGRLAELHEDYAESTVASVFATFSTFLNAAVRARIIPASPCSGVRVSAGEYVLERLVASPVRGLRAAMRLYQSELGLGGFTLCLADLYTGCRWSELVGQQRHEYDEIAKRCRRHPSGEEGESHRGKAGRRPRPALGRWACR